MYSYIDGNTTHYHITLHITTLNCDYCGGKCISHGLKEKIIHHPLIVDFDGIIHYHARRYICKDCRKTFFENNPFTFNGFNNSYALINRIMKHLSNLDLTMDRIAKLNHVSDTTVALYLDSYVNICTPTLPESIGIDEFHSKAMSNNDSAYLCILVDNIKRQPFDILPSRSKKHLDSYFSKFSKQEKNKVHYITIDMWEPYKVIALKHFKNAIIAADPFHVVKNISKAFTKIRVNIMNQLPYDSGSYYLLKKWHRLLDSYDINLDNDPKYNSFFKRKLNHRQLYEMSLDVSDKLKEAHKLKDSYHLFNEMATIDNCEAWLDSLIIKFEKSNINEFNECTQMLINWKREIVNSFNRPYKERKLSNALAENINSQLEAYLGLTRGNTNFIRFKKRVLLAMNKKIFYAISDRLASNKNARCKREKYNKK